VAHVFTDMRSGSFVEVLAKAMDNDKYEVCSIFLDADEQEFHRELRTKGLEIHVIRFSERPELPLAIWRLRRLFKKLRPDIVHTHLVNGSLAGLIAAKLCGIKRRVSFRHHSNEAHIYFPHAVYYDRVINNLSKRIAANTKMTADILTEMEGVEQDKVRVINYGFDLTSYNRAENDIDALKVRYEIKDSYPVIGVVSRFVHWKGVQHIIPAFARLLKDFPDAKLVMASAHGTFASEIDVLLKENLDEETYRTIDFEPNVLALFKTFDVFVHVPIGGQFEAFGQVYVEALAMSVPSVFTLSGVASDFIVHEQNALVVPHCDSDAIYKAIKRLLDEPELRRKLVANGLRDVFERFNSDRFGIQLDAFYSSLG